MPVSAWVMLSIILLIFIGGLLFCFIHIKKQARKEEQD